MKGNQKTILIWLLSWAVLIIIVIYSPIGSPELYIENKYVVYNQGVNFSGGIANAPKLKLKTIQKYEEHVSILPTYTPEQKTYSVKTYANMYRTVIPNTYRVSAVVAENRSTPIKINDYNEKDYAFNALRNRNFHKNTLFQDDGISSLNTDLTLNDFTSNRQLTTESALDGGTDPGGDPEGPPIPVGNGFWILLILVVGYAFYKRKSVINHSMSN